MKTLRHDGFNALLFKRAWYVVGNDIINAVLLFFEIGNVYSPTNSTIVTLISKIAIPTKIENIDLYHVVPWYIKLSPKWSRQDY